MPLAAVHSIIPMAIVAAIKRFLKIDKITPRMIIITGIFGLLPDIDMPVFFLLNAITTVSIYDVHRTISHSLVIPLMGLMVFAATYRHRSSVYALLFSLGTASHILLDAIVNGTVQPFYPFNRIEVGINMVQYLVPASVNGSSFTYRQSLIAGMDGIVITAFLAYLAYKNRKTLF